jgi:outer membrane protein OmpA-like peptidoglycan-associated protein
MEEAMRRWAGAGLMLFLAAAPAARAQEETCEVKADEVKTWTTTVGDKEYEVRPATPGYDGDTGLFHLSTAYTLPKGKWSGSLFRDNLDRDPKDVDFSIHGLTLGYGISDRLELFGSFGLQNRANVDAPLQPGFPNDYPFAGTTADSPGWQTGFGDIKVGAKYKVLDDYMGDGVGLAIRAVAKLPTADEEKGLGTGKFSGAADLVLSKNINRSADIHASIGYEINSDPDDVDIANALRWGIGLNLPSCKFFQLQAELMGKSYGDSDFEQTNPMDLVVGPVFWLKSGWFIRPAISWNLNFDDRGLNSGSSSSAGRQISIGYHPGTPCCAVTAAAPPPPPAPANRPPTVTVTCDTPVLAGQVSNCRASASDPDGDSITYDWTAGAGRINGSGSAASLDTTGMKEGDCTPVTVRVSDGRGGNAEAQARVCIKMPERRPEATTLCTSSGFPRNLSRLNNVDKACLDDVASRLKADPRARVVVIGHADSKERYPEVIARKRAEAIKDYLVKERGVEEARVSVRSAGATKALDTGTTAAAAARNRRVEVLFVPEGASVPDSD